MEAIKPQNLILGNFISCFGEVVMVKGITPREDGTFYVSHTGMKTDNPFNGGVEFDPMPLILNDRWKEVLKIDKVELPEWIKYVHEAQNHLLWSQRMNLLEVIDWSRVPARQDLEHEV